MKNFDNLPDNLSEQSEVDFKTRVLEASKAGAIEVINDPVVFTDREFFKYSISTLVKIDNGLIDIWREIKEPPSTIEQVRDLIYDVVNGVLSSQDSDITTVKERQEYEAMKISVALRWVQETMENLRKSEPVSDDEWF